MEEIIERQLEDMKKDLMESIKKEFENRDKERKKLEEEVKAIKLSIERVTGKRQQEEFRKELIDEIEKKESRREEARKKDRKTIIKGMEILIEKLENLENRDKEETCEAGCQTMEWEESTWKGEPRKLSKEEWEKEKEERRYRKRNVRLIGVRKEDEAMEAMMTVAAMTKVIPRVESVKKVDGGVRVRVKTWDNKMELITARASLKGTGLWLEDDSTEREDEIMAWLERERERLEKKGAKVKLMYLKAMVDETSWRWNEESGKMEVMAEGEEGRRQGGDIEVVE